MNWARLFQVIDVVVRYLIPCEAVTLYLSEEQGRYLRRVNTYLDVFPPSRRGHAVEAVSESTITGSAAINAEACTLPGKPKNRYATDWASHEAFTLTPRLPRPTLEDVAAGMNETEEVAPTVSRIRSVMAFPLCFGTAMAGDDPFMDYASVDSQQATADERVFAVLKLTNRLSSKGKKGGFPRVALGKNLGSKDEMKYQPFTKLDHQMCTALTSFLREVYFSIDPVTFGTRIEPSLNFNQDDDEGLEPLNAPSLLGRSAASGVSQTLPSGSRVSVAVSVIFYLLVACFVAICGYFVNYFFILSPKCI
ncbi:unnamed protein product [Polarella glacialis]|uniref:Uncharacterized protein n=1 Tax=Polarella glacialis TaxID=89957 RepID=A0A813J543_POLGL|nr:unnamed protein product [Polarella glacialis]